MSKIASVRLNLSHLFADCYSDEGAMPKFKLFIGGNWSSASKEGIKDIYSTIDDTFNTLVQESDSTEVE